MTNSIGPRMDPLGALYPIATLDDTSWLYLTFWARVVRQSSNHFRIFPLTLTLDGLALLSILQRRQLMMTLFADEDRTRLESYQLTPTTLS